MSVFKTYRQNENANVGMMFAILAVPLLISVGVAIDYSRLSSAHNKLQHAADAAALSGALAFVEQGEGEMETAGKNSYNLHAQDVEDLQVNSCLLYTSPSPRD